MVLIENIEAQVYSIPTDYPESDGTFEWEKTTMVLVKIIAGGQIGIGFTYSHGSAAELIRENFSPLIEGYDACDIPAIWKRLVEEVRNMGRPGIASAAISAIDIALWDLKAKCLNLPLYELWGKVRTSIPVYGSGGFTSYSDSQLSTQFEHWKRQGINKFKMKIGRHPEEDLHRVKDAKEVIGAKSCLFVDANGAYSRKQALEFAIAFKEFDVKWLEEPVSSDDLEGLHLLRNRAPEGMDITAGEYGYDIDYFRRMLEAQAVDVLQADVTRCGGFTGFFQAATLARAFHIPLSSHTAPSLHLAACLCLEQVCHMEYFHDHVRIEDLFFEGVPILKDGCLNPDPESKGLGLHLKEKDVEQYLVESKEKVYG